MFCGRTPLASLVMIDLGRFKSFKCSCCSVSAPDSVRRKRVDRRSLLPIHTSIVVESFSFLSLCGAVSLARSMSISGVSVAAVLEVVDNGGRDESAAGAETGDGSAGVPSPSTSANLAMETSLRRDESLLRGGMVSDQSDEFSRDGVFRRGIAWSEGPDGAMGLARDQSRFVVWSKGSQCKKTKKVMCSAMLLQVHMASQKSLDW